MRYLLFTLTFIVVSSAMPRGQLYRLPCTADTNLSSHESERDLNYGASTRIRLKGIQMLGLFRFATESVKGMVVRSARLHLRYAGGQRMLRTLGISTIVVPWEEGSGVGTRRPGQACFDEARLGESPWAPAAADFAEVIFCPPNVWSYQDIQTEHDDWVSVAVPAAAVQAMAAGLATGLAVTDEKGQTFANNDVYSREQSGSAPFLMVEANPGQSATPAKVTGIVAEPLPERTSASGTALRLRFVVPEDALGVRAKLVAADDGVLLRDIVLCIGRRGVQRVMLADLPTARRLHLSLWAVSRTGVPGPVQTIRVQTPPALLAPRKLPPARFLSDLKPCPWWSIGDVAISATSPDARLDPMQDPIAPPAKLWNGKAIEILTARGDTAALMLVLKGENQAPMDVSVEATLPYRVRISAPAYLTDGTLVPEACLPLASGADLSTLPTALPGQRTWQVLLEWLIPANEPITDRRGAIVVRRKVGPALRIPVVIRVHGPTIPAKPTFVLSLNTYGSPARNYGVTPASEEGISIEHAYHVLAHEHRATLMPLGYSHSGNVEPGYAPATKGTGRTRTVADWSGWDRRFGPLLTGELFRSRGVGSTPVTDIYLPFNEAWPEDIRMHYQYRPTTTAYPDIIVEHALLAGPIEALMTPDYAAGIRRIVAQFAQHIRSSKWRGTRFHFYLNNKHYYRDPDLGGRGTSWWLLDEPMNRDDWLALAYFARRMKEGLAGLPSHDIIFRADVSRPQWQRDYLDGLVHLTVVNDEIFRRRALMDHFRNTLGITLWHYGSPPRPSEPLVRCEEWPVRAYLAGADGIVPWQSLGQRSHYQQPEPTALILPGTTEKDGPVPTMRLKALARGVRTVEYLKLLAACTGWTREQVAMAAEDYLRTGDYSGLRAAVLQRLDAESPQGSERSQSKQSPGQRRLGRPRSPKPNP